jgi:predicted O-methyltransferase YrrM
MQWYQPSPPNAPIRPVPWLGMKVRQHLDNLIQPEWRVAEHGGGGSTIWLSSKCEHVTTVEQNLKWFNKLAELNLSRVMLVYGRHIPHFAEPLDMILIDGEPPEDRALWLTASVSLVRPGGWVMLDNANRPEYEKERKHMQTYAAEVVTFDCNERGTEYLITEFYQMPEKGGNE